MGVLRYKTFGERYAWIIALLVLAMIFLSDKIVNWIN
jgi:hypothetical protein